MAALLRRAGIPLTVLAAVFVCHAGLLAWSAARHSPTFQEPSLLAAGVSHWQLGAFNLCSVNPPAVRLIASLPVLVANPETEWSRIWDPATARPEDDIGVDFMLRNGQRSLAWVKYARWVCIPFSLLGAWICFAWARDLFGTWSGVLAAAQWSFCPYVLGFAPLIVADVPSAALAVSTMYCFWRWLRQPGWSRTFGTGLVLGLAELTKFTLLILYPLLILLWAMDRWRPRIPETRLMSAATLPSLLVMVAAAIGVTNLGYGFAGSFLPLGRYDFHSQILTGTGSITEISPAGGNRFRGTWIEGLPVPLPRHYVLGLDLQRRDFETGLNSYLAGEWSSHGWWYYYLYALAVKLPLGTWCLLALASLSTLFGRAATEWRHDLMVAIPGLAILALLSTQTGFAVHSRYVLPALPFLAVWSSRVLASPSPLPPRATRLFRWGTGLAAVWGIVSSLLVFPHSLAYFNETTGGPRNGPRHLLNSNIDWSQDLIYLKTWLMDHPEVRLEGLKFYGNSSTRLLGLPPVPWPPIDPRSAARLHHDRVFADVGGSSGFRPPTGWYALSVNEICSRSGQFRYFLEFEPEHIVGYSIYVYHVRDRRRLD